MHIRAAGEEHQGSRKIESVKLGFHNGIVADGPADWNGFPRAASGNEEREKDGSAEVDDYSEQTLADFKENLIACCVLRVCSSSRFFSRWPRVPKRRLMRIGMKKAATHGAKRS